MTENLNRFSQVFSSDAEICTQQLGWQIAVLPFRSTGDANGYGMALGMAEEISAAVSRYRSPRLIAPVTFWDGHGPAADFSGRCRLYKLDYVIEGTIQVVRNRVRVNITLSDVVLNFEVIWSGSFDADMHDLHFLQDRVAQEIISQLDPDLLLRQCPTKQIGLTDIAEAHRSVLTAVHWLMQLDRQKFMRARELLLRATTLDANYAAAHTWLAYWNIIAVSLGWANEPLASTTMAGAAAKRAMTLDADNARALAIAGHVTAYLLYDVPAALKLHAKAVDLDPNLAIVWALSSWSRIYNGEHTTAIKHALTAQMLSPRDPHIFFSEHAMIAAYFFSGQLAEAEMIIDIVLSKTSSHAAALRISLGVYGHLGRTEEASVCLQRLRKIDSSTSIQTIVGRAPFKETDRTFYAEGLRRAGVSD